MSAETLQSLIDAGSEALEKGQYLEAVRIFREAGAIEPANFEVLRGIGIAKTYINTAAEDAHLILEAAAKLNNDRLDPVALRAFSLSLAYSGQTDRAIAACRTLIDAWPFFYHYYWWAEQVLATGRLDEAWAAGRELLMLRDSWNQEADGPDIPVELVPDNILTTTIGELAFRMEVLVKARAMGWPLPRRMILRFTHEPVNPVFAEYWRDHVEVEYLDMPRDEGRKVLNTLFYWTPAGTVVDKQFAYAQLSRQWRERKLPPVLTLKDQHRREGEAVLRRAGVPEGAWYVCLHMRSAAFNDQGLSNHNALRNVDIETYLPAVRRVVEEGGWVLRMGDPGMPPLPEMEHVVDYARSPLKSALMDVFLCATCRFFIASQSGLQYVAKNFGRPLVATNQLPYVLVDLDDDEDLWIPRKIHSDKLGRPLSFREAFSPPYVNTEVRSALDRLGVRPLANTAEEIEAVVTEMLDRLAGRIAYSDSDNRLQQRFRRACNFHGHGQCGRVGRAFLRDHIHYL